MVKLWLILALLLIVSPAQAGITFVDGTSGGAIDGGDVTLTMPGGVIAGDLVIVAYTMAANVDRTMAMTTSGYAAVPGGTDLYTDDTIDTNLGVFYKFMGASPDANAVVTGDAAAATAVSAALMVFRGVSQNHPFDAVNAAVVTTIDTFLADAPSLDHNNPPGVVTVIALGAGRGTGTACSFPITWTFPTGYTTNAKQNCSQDTNESMVGLGYRTNPADPENPNAVTSGIGDSTNFSSAAVTMALRPGTGGFLIDRTPIGDFVNGGMVR